MFPQTCYKARTYKRHHERALHARQLPTLAFRDGVEVNADERPRATGIASAVRWDVVIGGR